MKIGITERGDAGIDLSWTDKLRNHAVDGVVVITKNINDIFINNVMELYNSGFTQIIVHCTCTGWGGSDFEPKVPFYQEQLRALQGLIDRGFPKRQCVIRIDPIIPTNRGIEHVKEVLAYAQYKLGLLPDMRIRISILDEYKHVKQRFIQKGLNTVYEDSFYAPKEMVQNVIDALNKYELQFECCAEPYLNNGNQFVHLGCVSLRDCKILGLEPENELINPQNRYGCQCLMCKTELLENKGQCPHQCIYCYWKNRQN